MKRPSEAEMKRIERMSIDVGKGQYPNHPGQREYAMLRYLLAEHKLLREVVDALEPGDGLNNDALLDAKRALDAFDRESES